MYMCMTSLALQDGFHVSSMWAGSSCIPVVSCLCLVFMRLTSSPSLTDFLHHFFFSIKVHNIAFHVSLCDNNNGDAGMVQTYRNKAVMIVQHHIAALATEHTC